MIETLRILKSMIPREIKFDLAQFLMIMCGFWFVTAEWFWYNNQENYQRNKELYMKMDGIMHDANLVIEARMNAVLTCEQRARKSLEADDLREQVRLLQQELESRKSHLQLMSAVDWR